MSKVKPSEIFDTPEAFHFSVPKPMKQTKEQRKLQRVERKLEKAKQAVHKAKLMSLPELKRKVQKEVNAYVRLRDQNEPCISCGTMNATWQAGHFIAQGSSGALRFNLDNIHKQCVTCNLYKHANLLEYRINLIEKWKHSALKCNTVEWLEEHRHDVKKWTREELEEIRRNIKELTNNPDLQISNEGTI